MSTGPIEHLMRVAPRRPTVRTPPIEPSAVSREPAGSSTRTSTDSLGPMKLNRGFGPVIVSRRPSKSTVVSSAPRRSTAFAGLVGVTVTTVSVRSPATTSIAPTGRWMATSIGVGVVYVGMAMPAFLVGVFVRPRGFAWLVGRVGLAGLAGPAGEAVAGAQRALRGSSLLGLECGGDRPHQPRVDGQAVRRPPPRRPSP